MEMAEFKVQIKCMWNSETGEFENLAGEEESMQDNEEDDDDAEWNIINRAACTLFLVILANFQQHRVIDVETIHPGSQCCLWTPIFVSPQTFVLHLEF